MGTAAKPKSVVVQMRAWTDKEALAWLAGKGRIETSAAALGRDWRWDSKKVKAHLDRWSSAGHIEVKPGLSGRTAITTLAPAVGGPAGPVQVGSVAPAASVTAPSAAVPTPATGNATSLAVKTEPTESAPVAGEIVADVTPPPVASAQPGSPAPLPAPVSAPEPPAHESAVLLSSPEPPASEAALVPAKVGAAPEPAIMRAPRPPLAATLPPAPPVTAAQLHFHPRGSGFVNALAYLVAVALAGIAAYFSISGMIVLFPGAPAAIVTMGVVMEAAKLVTVAFLAHQWRVLAGLSRLVLIILVAGLAAINAAGVYSQLVAAHFGDRVAATSEAETEAATLAAKTEVQVQTVADLDRRVAQIDGVIAEMTKRGRTSSALDAIATQRKQRDALVAQRRHEAEALAALKTDAAAVAARTHRIEVEAAPIMYVAQLMGGTTEQAIRLLILLMVLTCDPLAVALTAAASRPRWRRP